MGIRIYHQVGHNPNWNLESFTTDSCGDGLIFSPVHQPKEKIEQIGFGIKKRSVFDPQYYLPNSQKKKLSSYPFFPEKISHGFSTQDFPLVALESARQCIQFQLDQGFEKILIPARYHEEMVSDYIEQQEEYTVHPFLKVLAEIGTSKPIFLTLPLTSAMVQDKGFRTKILNWVTGFPEISGIYILVNYERPTKQIQSSDFLYSYMELMSELTSVGLGLIVGHANTESLLYSLVDESTQTFGSFENTRMFSLDKFVASEEDRQGPKARIYLPALLNWIQFNQAREIHDDKPALWSRIYRPTSYGDGVFASKVEPHFNQPPLYRHHFICFYEQIKNLASLRAVQRYELLREWIQTAMGLHREIRSLPLILDQHGSGDHLQPWLDTITRYYRNFLKG